jgi:hypothetical protein
MPAYTSYGKATMFGADAHSHTPTQHTKCTHVICDMPWKALDVTDVIPFVLRSRTPTCVGQEPVRTSGAKAVSPLKVQPPKLTVHGAAEAPLDAVSSIASKRRPFNLTVQGAAD